MNPQLFGWEHFTYLAVMIVIGVAVTVLIKKFCKSDKALSIAIRIYSFVLLFWIVTNRALIAVNTKNPLRFLPDSFCGTMSMCLSLVGLFSKKDSKLFHWIVYCGLLGGFLTMIYPDFLPQNPSLFYLPTLSGLMHHTVAFFLCVTIIATGYMRISIKRWAYLPVGLAFEMVWGIFLITALGFSDALVIYSPLIEGTPFTWYFTGLLFLILHLIVLLTVEFVRLKKNGGKVMPVLKAQFNKLKNYYKPSNEIVENLNDNKNDENNTKLEV